MEKNAVILYWGGDGLVVKSIDTTPHRTIRCQIQLGRDGLIAERVVKTTVEQLIIQTSLGPRRISPAKRIHPG